MDTLFKKSYVGFTLGSVFQKVRCVPCMVYEVICKECAGHFLLLYTSSLSPCLNDYLLGTSLCLRNGLPSFYLKKILMKQEYKDS